MRKKRLNLRSSHKLTVISVRIRLFFSLQVSKLIVLDPHKRLSVREALQHPWVLGKAARFSHMDTTQRKLQEFNARRKLKVSKPISVDYSNKQLKQRRS